MNTSAASAHRRLRIGAPLWPVVVRALSRPPAAVDALLETMATLRRAVGGEWGLGRLQALLGSVLDDAGRAELLGEIVPTLCELVLETPRHFRAPLRLLRSGGPGSVELSAEQCACLLANAFFCTMPNRNDTPRGRGGDGPVAPRPPEPSLNVFPTCLQAAAARPSSPTFPSAG